MKILILIVCLFAMGFSQNLQAQPQIANSSAAVTDVGSSKHEAKLNGQVRRVRVETVNLLIKEGKTIEGPRVVREITTYDQKGQAIDSVSYPSEDSAAGKKEYLYDPRGNVIEMVLRGDDGSILSKEKYDYQFDEFGNWKKMTASIAVYENGNVGYEPSAITYRTITYYFGQPAPRVVPAPTVTPVSNTGTTATALDSTKTTTPATDESARAAVTESPTTDARKPSDIAEAPTVEPEKTGPSIIAPVVVTPKEEAPKLAVIRMSEEALRKAAIDLPKPVYPEAAMLAGAEGNVEVQIVVDEKGDVTNASSLSGNPLFSEVAVAAARKAKFSRTKLSAEPARIFGVINYTFTLPSDPPAPALVATSASAEPKKNLPAQRTSEIKMVQPAAASESPSKRATNSRIPAASSYADGSTLMTAGRYSEAAEALRQATERDPNDAAAYAKLGIAYAVLQQNEEAVAVLKMAMRIKPEILDAEAYYQLSNAYTALGKFPQALEAVKQAMYIKRAEQAAPIDGTGNTSRSPSLAELHYTIGLAYYNERRNNEAIDEMKRVIAIDPKLTQAYYALGLAYIALGDRKSAEKQQQTLESLDPVYAAKIAKLLSRLRNDQGIASPRKSLVF